MKQDFELKLQAYLDGELPAGEVSAVAAQIESDAEARALHADLQQMRTLLRSNEMERRLPQTREFYWSQIEREITRQESQAARTSSSCCSFGARPLAFMLSIISFMTRTDSLLLPDR